MKINLFSSITRQSLLKSFLLLIIGFILSKINIPRLFASEKKLPPRKKRPVRSNFDLAAVTGNDIEAITRKSIDLLGGMKRFVNKNDIIVVKPNMGWNREPRFAATTNPVVVATVVKMCYEAGAKVVKVFDYSCNNLKMCYKQSGVQDAANQAGAQVQYISDWKFIPGDFPATSPMKDWPIYRDAVYCDCFINIPIAKHHYLTEVTLSMKNLMGICAENRGNLHWNISQKLADLTEFIKPDLNIIDGYRILVRNGPIGGNLGDVRLKKTIIASPDPVLADAYAVKTLFNKSPRSISTIQEGAKHKLGNMNIATAKIKAITI